MVVKGLCVCFIADTNTGTGTALRLEHPTTSKNKEKCNCWVCTHMRTWMRLLAQCTPSLFSCSSLFFFFFFVVICFVCTCNTDVVISSINFSVRLVETKVLYYISNNYCSSQLLWLLSKYGCTFYVRSNYVFELVQNCCIRYRVQHHND